MGIVYTGNSLRGYRICSRHFSDENYLNKAKGRLLRNAVTTLFSSLSTSTSDGTDSTVGYNNGSECAPNGCFFNAFPHPQHVKKVYYRYYHRTLCAPNGCICNAFPPSFGSCNAFCHEGQYCCADDEQNCCSLLVYVAITR
jgi:hypothetical protein